MNSEQKYLLQMRVLLYHNVPRFIACIKSRGGVKPEEWEWLQYSKDTSTEHPEGIMARADEYLVCPNSVEKFKKGLSVLVKAIAIMSFVPGGIHTFGLWFSPEIDGFVVIEDGSTET
ncbi:hypothetical protein ACX27_04215 [Nostoc piscinale CENA21]|uniref:Uncharacterized protein n=1 Tax=Nostoc piscinale CENA21 TaxID=224013 RepID=A0A0M4SIG8_9NOSO|nr:hypothetical protein [Nostoc piscinale]ALF52235.1 hypothetical protein ACX27_04215 [Nostoc piscinale CENA21]